MGEPNLVVPLALVAFMLVAGGCFAMLHPSRAVARAMLGGWLLLPEFDARSRFLGFYSKLVFVPTVVLLMSIAFDLRRWSRFRPRLFDLPMAVLCVVPFFTANANSLGSHEAIAAMADQIMGWGAPYMLGRVYLGEPRAVRDYAYAFVGAALLYVPLCLIEIRLSPILHYKIYGFRTFGFDQSIRFGGYRPSVFLEHGLALGMFVAAGALTAFWLWRASPRERVGPVPMGWAVAMLLVTLILCKSTGAVILCLVGIAMLEAARRFRTGAVILAVALLPTVYCAARTWGWNPDQVVSISNSIGEDRSRSVEFRFENERLLIAKAMQRPLLGWGRFSRSFIYDEFGYSRGVIADSMWIIALGMTGLLGLVAMGAVLALPAIALLRTYPGRSWADPRLAPAAALTTVVLIWAIDNLLNAMMTPLYPAISGALISFVCVARTARVRQPRPGKQPGARWALQHRS